jgi:ABC-type dipeptide/oligopeptide/nickel transport system ATPase component
MAASNKLKIRRFPIDEMKPKRIILIVGKRGTGKSTLLKDILYHVRKRVDTGFAMSPTQDTIRMFEDCMPKSHIYNEYSLETVRNMINSLESLQEQGKNREVCLAIDDCMFDKGIMKTREMREIHMNGRHLGLWFINSVQYLMDLGPDLRSQIDYIFALKENVISNRQKLHKYFFGIFEKYEEFSLVMDKCTNNHECLVLDNTQPNNKIEESIFYYKADNTIGRFKLGKTIYYKLDHYFRKTEDKNKFGQGQNGKTKLPDPIQTKMRIQQVEKEDTTDQ